MNVYPFIEAERARQGNVSRTCALLSVSRAAYYGFVHATPSGRQRRDAELTAMIVATFTASRRTYGPLRIAKELRQRGQRVSRRRIARLMVARGLVARPKRSRKITTIADPAAAASADLLARRFDPATHGRDAVWCGDISYVRTWEGWAYLATVIDLSSRRVVGLAMADHLRTSLVSEALQMALTARRPGPGLIFHTDRGCQYTSDDFRKLLGRYEITQSLSRPRQCWDNAVAESFFATLKEELIYRRVWPTRAALRRAVFEYVEVFYNRQRLHSSLGYLSPADYEAGRRQHLSEAQAA